MGVWTGCTPVVGASSNVWESIATDLLGHGAGRRVLVADDPAEVLGGRQSLIQSFYSILEHHDHFLVGQPALASGRYQLVNSLGEFLCGYDDLLSRKTSRRLALKRPRHYPRLPSNHP